MNAGAWPLLLGSLLLPISLSGILERFFLYFPEPELILTPSDMGLDYEDVNFTAEDGTRLHGWFLPGENGQPLVVFCHGNAGNISHRLDNLRRLRELGLAVFIFDYRGYGRSEGRPSEPGSYSDMRGALAWLQQQGWEGREMIYFGRSIGAGVALQLALEQPPGGVILESPFTSIAAMGKQHYPLLWLMAGWLLEARYDNLGKIDRLKTPLLIFHGNRDEIVPQEMGRELFEAAPHSKSFHSISGAGHNDTYERGGADYWQQWRTFIGQYFGAEARPGKT